MPTLDPRLILAFVWLMICSGIAYWLLIKHPERKSNIFIILTAALLVRFIPALILPRGAAYEMHVFQQAAQLFRAGENIYAVKTSYPYFPLLIYWFAAADWLAQHVGLFFIFWLKSINILADTAVTFIVYLALKESRGSNQASLGAWIYAFNPITLLVVSYQGQFDATTIFFLLSSWYFLEFHRTSRYGLFLSSLALGFAILAKTWPVFFLPIVLFRLPDWNQRFRYSILAGIVPLLSLSIYELLFAGSWLLIIMRALKAGAVSGWWGYSAIANVYVELTGKGQGIYNFVGGTGKYFGQICGIVTIFLTRKRPALYSLLVTILVLFATVPNLGLQGLSWVIPMALILGKLDELGWYLAGAQIYKVVSYWGIHLTRGLYLIMPDLWANITIQLSSLSAWLVIVFWSIQEFSKIRLLPPLHKKTLLLENHAAK